MPVKYDKLHGDFRVSVSCCRSNKRRFIGFAKTLEEGKAMLHADYMARQALKKENRNDDKE